jgi:hypothetical protein
MAGMELPGAAAMLAEAGRRPPGGRPSSRRGRDATPVKLTFTLPSLFPDVLHRAIHNINETVRDIDFEIVVVSPFPVDGPRVRWVKEETPQGNCLAHTMGYEAATGDIVAAVCDDVLLLPGAVERALSFFLDREGRAHHYALGLSPYSQTMGTVFGIYYPYFPMLRRKTIEEIGGYYRPCFRAHFGDVDIGMRVWSAGGRCEVTPFPVLHFMEAHEDFSATLRNETQHRDMETFLSFWGEKYGQGWDQAEVWQFNLDMNKTLQLFLKEEHTVNFNHPIVRAIYHRVHTNLADREVFLHIGRPNGSDGRT